MRSTILALAAALSLSACLELPVQPEIQHSAATRGDFGLLSCGELSAAEAAVRQRIVQPAEGGVYAFGVYTPDGTPVAERKSILDASAQELERIRRSRACDGGPETRETATLKTAKAQTRRPAVAETESASAFSSAAPSPPKPTKTTTANQSSESIKTQRGRFLQVATFGSTANRDAAIEAFKTRGIMARSEPIIRNGREMHRILIGPIRSRADISRADKAAEELGLGDGFFVDG